MIPVECCYLVACIACTIAVLCFQNYAIVYACLVTRIV